MTGGERADEGLQREALGSTDRIVVARRFWRVVGPEVRADAVAALSVYLREGTLLRHDPHEVNHLVTSLVAGLWAGRRR